MTNASNQWGIRGIPLQVIEVESYNNPIIELLRYMGCATLSSVYRYCLGTVDLDERGEYKSDGYINSHDLETLAIQSGIST